MAHKKEVRLRHKVITTMAKLFVIPYAKIKYRYKYKKYKNLKKDKPFLVLGNHTIPWDPILMGLCFPFHLYYFATEQIFNLGFLSKLLTYAVNPIKKSKSINDLAAIRKAMRIVKEKGSIGVFLEGNVTYDGETTSISPAIVKLIRLLKIPVAIFKTEGLYFSNPRWAVYEKKGKSKGEVTKTLYPKEYNQMSDDDLYVWIKEALYTNAYDAKEEVLYKGKEIALGLERLVFMDLKTMVPFENYSKGNMLKSHVSDFSLTYQPNGYLIDSNGNKHTLVSLNKEVIKSYIMYLRKLDTNEITSERVNLRISSEKENINLLDFTLSLNKDGLILSNDKEELEFKFSNIEALAIQGKRKIIFYSEKTYLITLDGLSSPYKYLLTYQYYQYKGELED